MKYILILSLFFGALLAKSSDACYSVQLTSFYLKHNSSYNFKSRGYPDSCILVNINGLRSVRCGCFENYRDAEDKLDRLLSRYDDAMIVNTYKRRFAKSRPDTFTQDRRDDIRSKRESRVERTPRYETQSKRDRVEANFDNYTSKSSSDRIGESDYPSATKFEERESTLPKRAYKDDDYAEENYNKSFYEEEDPKAKHSFYGDIEEEEDDLYKEDKPVKKQDYSHDKASSSYGTYRRSTKRDYARSSNRW